MRRPLAVVLLIAAALTMVAGATSVPAADGPTPRAAGWWWRAQTGTGPRLDHPGASDAHLVVAGAPDGATAVVALRYQLADDQTDPRLTLTVSEDGDRGGDQAVLAACLTGSPWAPTGGAGVWDDKPKAACAEGSVSGVRSDDGSTWTFALDALTVDGLVDVVIVPGTLPDLPEGANGSSFELVFEGPGPSALQVDDEASGSTGGGFVPPPVEFPTSDNSAGRTATPPVASAPGPAPRAAAPSTAAPFTPALPEDDQGYTAIAPSRERSTRPLVDDPIAATTDPRLFGVGVLLALIGGSLYLGRKQLGLFERLRPARAGRPRVTVIAELGGLDRFSRPRAGPAPPLL